MTKLSPSFCMCILVLFTQAIFMNDALAYPNEVRPGGSGYIWRINDVDQGSTSSLATAINNCMSGSRIIHVLAGGSLTATLTVRATNVKLYCHGNTFTRNFSGTGVINTYSGFEIHDMILRGGSNGYGIRSSRASNLKFINVQVYDCPWIGIRVDSRESNPWDYWVSNLEVRNCRFENIGSHGLETYSVDGVTIDGIVARNCGECGVLLNQSKNGTIGTVDAYRCSYGGGYAGLRFANTCSNIVANSLIARECGRGYFVLTGSNNCHLNNARITDCSGIGIWLENVVNCSVKAGCTNDGVSVSGSGSYANVSNTCSSTGGTYYRIQNRGTGLFLDGMGRTTNGSVCGQYANTTSNNAQWEMISTSGYTQFRNRGTGLLLDGMGRTTNGSDLGQYANTTHVNSQWSVQTYSGSYVRIQNRGTGLFIDGMGRTANGSACGQYANTTSVNAQWQLIAVSSTSARMETAGTEEQTLTDEETAVDVYPNPARSVVTITLPGSYKDGEKIVNLVDVNGKTVVSERIRGRIHTLNIGGLPQGIYLLQVNSNNKLIVKKLVKK